MNHRVSMQLPLMEPMVGVRLHQPTVVAKEDEGTVQYLLDLKEREEERRTAHHAVMKCVGRIATAVEPIPAMIQARLDDLGAMVTEIGLAVARELVGEALDRHLVDPTPVVQRCLRDSVAGTETSAMTIALSPSDLGPVLDQLQSDTDLSQRIRTVDFRSDPALGPGEVRADTGSGTLVYRPEEVLERLCEAVREEVGGARMPVGQGAQP